MSILSILLALAVFGFILWLIVTYIPMPQPIKQAIIVIAVIFIILWLMSGLGLLGGLTAPIRLR